MGWYSAGPIVDPSNDEILADTGALGLGLLTCTVMVYTTYTCIVYVERRNALNTSTVNSQPVQINSGSDVIKPLPIAVNLGERVRLRLETGFTGSLQASILTG